MPNRIVSQPLARCRRTCPFRLMYDPCTFNRRRHSQKGKHRQIWIYFLHFYLFLSSILAYAAILAFKLMLNLSPSAPVKPEACSMPLVLLYPSLLSLLPCFKTGRAWYELESHLCLYFRPISCVAILFVSTFILSFTITIPCRLVPCIPAGSDE